MFGFKPKDKQKIIDKKLEEINQAIEEDLLTDSMEDNLEIMKKLFSENDTFVVRTIQNNHNKRLKFYLLYLDGLINSLLVNESVIRPLMLSDVIEPGKAQINSIMDQVVMVNQVEKTNELKEIISAITYGDSILLVEGASSALILNTKNFQTRSIEEPDGEKILSGPKEGFTEALMTNLGLVRRKLRTNDLKMKFLTLGQRSSTKTCVCYLDSLVNPKILKELMSRLNKINIDGVLDTNYINELIRDSVWTPFRTTGYTERPDVVVGKLLEGRIAIFLDGSPAVLTVPYLFIENFQSSEDYYLNFYYTSFARILRIVGFLLTITIPGFYIAIAAFHQEMLPTPLLISIAIERQSVPFPAAVEAFAMLIVFDILKETGVRMPSNVGQALSIVGALVIGQAAVEAKLVAAPMIIVVAMTGITSLLIPRMNAPTIYMRYSILILSSAFGLYGLTLGLSAWLIHMLNLRTLGVPQLISMKSVKYQEVKDTLIRAPWIQMKTRPDILTKDKTRLNMQDGTKHENKSH